MQLQQADDLCLCLLCLMYLSYSTSARNLPRCYNEEQPPKPFHLELHIPLPFLVAARSQLWGSLPCQGICRRSRISSLALTVSDWNCVRYVAYTWPTVLAMGTGPTGPCILFSAKVRQLRQGLQQRRSRAFLRQPARPSRSSESHRQQMSFQASLHLSSCQTGTIETAAQLPLYQK